MIETETRLGLRQIDPAKVVEFPKGLIGYEDKHRFTLLKIRDDSPFLVLQSLDDPSLGLLVSDPYNFTDDYSVQISDAEQELLQVKSAKEVSILVTASIPHGRPDHTSLNLLGPILINHEARIGLQVPQTDINPPRLMLRLYVQNQEADSDPGLESD